MVPKLMLRNLSDGQINGWIDGRVDNPITLCLQYLNQSDKIYGTSIFTCNAKTDQNLLMTLSWLKKVKFSGFLEM